VGESCTMCGCMSVGVVCSHVCVWCDAGGRKNEGEGSQV
jgi:hypothetical protein